MDAKVQKALTWSGPAMILLWVGSFIVLAGFIPVPSPNDSAEEVVRRYDENTFGIQLGMILTMLGTALLVPFSAVIWSQMRRIDGAGGALAMTQIASGALLSMEFIMPLIVWQTAAFRHDQESARIIQMLNDMGWLMFVSVVCSFLVQMAAIAAAILIDRRSRPIFPRWSGYLTAWVALLVAPAGIVVFWKQGPFAWNGLFGFYVPLTSYCVWMVTMFVLLRRAIDDEARESAQNGASAASAPPEPALVGA